MRKFIILLIMPVLVALAPYAAQGAGNGDEGVTFNFVDVEISAVAKFVSDVTGKNFIFDDRIKGRITIIAPSPLHADDAFNLFSSVLNVKGYTLLPSGVNVYKIMAKSAARQSGLDVSVDARPITENYIARLITLNYISSDDALRFLQPVVSKAGHISSFGPGNLLLVVDSGLNIEKILEIVKSIDQPRMSEEPDVVFLQHSSAEAVAKVLNMGLSKRPKKGASREGTAVADTRLNAVILFGSRSDKDTMRRLIMQIDVAAKDAYSQINVYFLENADAEELAKVLTGLTKSTAKMSKQKAAKLISPFESATGISITPDKSTNALVVIASPSDYKSLLSVIERLDRRRKQVFVEALIVEASIDKLRDLGTKWRLAARKDGAPVAIGGVGTIDASAMQSILFGLSGLTFGGTGNYMSVPVTQADGTIIDLTVPGFSALFSASEFNGVVNVLSSPQILTSNNTEAEIIVGENVPFISKREREATTNTTFNSIERRDVGITLRITPQITEGNHVKLDIYQEISSVKESSTDIITSVGPTTTKRSTKTTVVVQDDHTVVISGLMQERTEESITQVPLLGRIPILGWLFKFKNVSKVKTNLLVFLTPHIIDNSAELQRLTEEKRNEYARKEELFKEGELIVKFNPEITDEQALEIFESHGATIIRFFRNIMAYHIKLPEGQSVKQAQKLFFKLPEVDYAEPNYTLSIKGEQPAGMMRAR